MGKSGRRGTSPQHSLTVTKRKHSSASKQCDDNINHSKRRRLVHRKSETLNPKPHRSLTPPPENEEPVRCTASSPQRRPGRNKEITSSYKRDWVNSSNEFTNLKDKAVVVSYNLLGVENASKHPDLYFNIPWRCLEWDRRKNLICKEIKHYKASILCFQEVDRFGDLVALLKKDGYKGVHKGRTGEACDGCAIFWKRKQFSLLHCEDIEFERFGLRNNVAQLCVLEMNRVAKSKTCEHSSNQETRCSRRIVVGNIHVLYNPKRGDLKLGQARLFLDKAYKLSREWGNAPVVIAGDWNSTPRSPIYKFLASSELDTQLHDRRRISGQCDYEFKRENSRGAHKYMASDISLRRSVSYGWSDEELRHATGSEADTLVRHQLNLCSVYARVPGTSRTRDFSGEPLATSYHSKFMGTVDYIWHTQELVPLRVLETLPLDVLKKNRGLPSEKWGSDHLAIACELAFSDDPDNS